MILKHSALYVIARGVPGLVGFMTIVIYTRLLSPDAYGVYALVFTGSVICNAILYQWLSASLIRFIPEKSVNESDLLTAILNGYIAASIVAGLITLAIAITWTDSTASLLWVGILLVWAQGWFTINLELTRSRLVPRKYGYVSLLKAALALAIGVTLIMLGYGALGALAGLLLGLSIAALWAARGQWKPFRKFSYDAELVRKLLVYGLPLTASFALAVVVSGTDRFMLAAMISESATGLYSASQGLAQQGVGVSMTMVNLAAYPIILRTLERDGIQKAREQLRKNAILLLGVGLPVMAGFVVLAQDIAELLLGQEFKAAGTELMPWLAIAAFMAGMRAYYFDLPFYLGKSTRTQLVVMATAATLNVFLNYRLIPDFGYMGAVYASVGAHFVALVLSALLGRRAFVLPSINSDILRLSAATLIAALVLGFLPSGESAASLLGRVGAASVVYFCGLVVLDVQGVRLVASRSCERIVNVLRRR